MEAKMFSDGAMIKMGWAKAKENIGLFFGAMIVAGLTVYIPMFLLMWIGDAADMPGLFGLLSFIAYLGIGGLIGAGLVRMFLNVADGKKPEISMLFGESKLIVNFILVNLLYGIITMIGLFLFIIPGVIWSMKYMFAPMLVVDKGMKPMDALKESARLTDGMKWDLFAFYHVLTVFIMLGYLALFVGVFVTVPAGMIALMGVYRRFSPAGAAPAPAAKPAM